MPAQYPFIDMHTHLFTARYLPLHGIFRSFGVPGLLARGLSRIANAITGISDFEDAEDANQDDLVEALLGRDADRLMLVTTRRTRWLIRRYQEFAERSPEEEERLQDALGGLDDLAVELGDQGDVPVSSRLLHGSPLSEKSVFGLDVDTPDDLDSLLARGFAKAGAATSGSSFFHDAVHLHLEEDFAPETDVGLRAVGLSAAQVSGLRQVLLFVGVMALSERNRYAVLEKDYARNKPAGGHDATHYVGVLMDMQEAYAEIYGRNLRRPHFEFKTQMSRMNKLAGETGGKLISFGAVDPFRSKDWKSYVRHGVANGAKGFKIYCPLGYRPIDDTSYVTPVDPAGDPDGFYRDRAGNLVKARHAQEAMAEILPYFSREELRLFTHCTPVGFSAQNGYGIYADPELWRRAMERHGAQDLWLFLGHGGGATKIDWHGWAAESDTDFENTFAWRAIQLVQAYDNVYLGLGYITEIFNQQSRNIIFRRLKHHLTSPKPDGARHHFRDKVCFGTDWSMPQAIGRTRAYLDAFYEFFDDDDIREHAPAFFEGNARRYLGLAPTA